MATHRTVTRIRGALAIAVTAAVASACGNTANADDIDASYAKRMTASVREAKSAGASPAQVAILERAAAQRRPPTFDDYRSAVEQTVACMRDAGLRVGGPSTSMHKGVEVLGYTYGASERVPEDRVLPTADPCINEHSAIVELVWQSQPDAVRYVDRTFYEYRDRLIECLRRRGASIASDASQREVSEASRRLTEQAEKSAGPEVPGCEMETGFADAVG